MMLRTFAALGLCSLVAASAIANTTAPAVEARKTDARASDDTRKVGISPETFGTPLQLPPLMGRPAMKRTIPAEVLPATVVAKKPTDALRIPTESNGASNATGRLIIKFHDDLKARASMEPGTRAISLAGQDLSTAETAVTRFGGTIRQLVAMPPTKIEQIQRKAFERSNRIQPDLASMMLVEFKDRLDDKRLLAAARALNDLDVIQWVEIEQPLKRASAGPPPQGCDPGNAVICNRPNPNPGQGCWDGPGTAAPFLGFCNPDPGNANDAAEYGCADVACCDIVSGLNENCGEEDGAEGWDVYCAALANLFCQGSVYDTSNPALESPDRYDGCLSNYDPDGDPLDPAVAVLPEDAIPNIVFANVAGALLGPCDEAHPAPGCNQPACCASVCVIDPTCCTDEWDESCVAFTETTPSCGFEPTPGIDPTPDFASYAINGGRQAVGPQAYTVFAPAGVPGDQADPADSSTWFLASGFLGGGHDLAGMERFVGQVWRNYGSAGSGSNAGSAVLPEPDKVWLYGAQYEVVEQSKVSAEAWNDAVAGGFFANPDLSVPPGPDNPFPNFTQSDPNFPWDEVRFVPTGRTSQGAVIEFSAYAGIPSASGDIIFTHEDLKGTTLPGSSTEWAATNVESGQTQFLIDSGNAQHGTACLGVIGSRNNGIGTRGIASECELWFFPTVSVEEGERLVSSILAAANTLDEGAVVNYSIGFGTQPITTVAPVYTALAVATDAGLVNVCAAGNSAVAVEAPAGEQPVAIVVGACEPGFENADPRPPCPAPGPIRRSNFSNFTGDGTVHVMAWGSAGATTGYGDLFNGETSTDPTDTPPPLLTNQLRTYTGPRPGGSTVPDPNGGPPIEIPGFGGGFSGTSFASPQIAGAMVWIQGVSEMFYGTSLSTEQILGGSAGPSIVSGAENCYQFPDGTEFGNDNPNGGDYFAEQEGHNIGIFPYLPSCALNVLTVIGTNISGDFVVYHGDLINGRAFSLGNDDNNKVVIRSEFAGQGSAEGGLAYLANGQTTDLGVNWFTGYQTQDVQSCELNVLSQATASVVVELAWAYNFRSSRFQPLGATVMTAFEQQNNYDMGAFGTPSAFFSEPEGEVSVRIYSVGLGFIGTSNYKTLYDQVALNINDPNQPNDP